MASDWSSDSRWISYTLVTATHFRRVYLYSVEEGKSTPVTDGMSDAVSPVFDPEGKYLFFLASTDAGPVINSNWTKEGFIVENVGVEPDVEVEQWPADVIQGKDPQLEEAIRIVMEELKQNPAEKPVRPPYPIRVRK